MFGIVLIGIVALIWLCYRILALLFSFQPIRWVINSTVFLLRLVFIAVIILLVILMAVLG